MLSLIIVAILMAQAPAATTAPPPPQSAEPAAQSTTDAPWPPAGVFRFQPGGDVTAPRIIKSARPEYTAEAMRAKIQGVVTLEAVVQPDGTVREVRIKRSLDRKFGLDDAAVKSVKDYRFTPGMKDGVAVPVLVSIEVSFALAK
jgi:TonB family protein